jgi:hypothetical protein
LRPFLDDYVVTVKKDQLPPIPAVRPDMALVVVVCPAIDGDHAGGGSQYRLYANGTIVAVTKMGTYNYLFLEPGRYTLLSKAGNASALDIQLEAGEEYDFFQNTFSGWVSVKNTLTRQSRELVSYEVRGAYYATWQPK